ncbi:MAG: hypothetical protein ABR973_12375 [Candidatus Acidiferrales bacterium]|jgi:hypothetical protein
MGFIRYWWLILRHLPVLFWRSANRVRTIAAVVILLAFATNRSWGKLITSKWEGLPGRYVWVAIGLILLWGIMQVIYEGHEDMASRLAAFEAPDSSEASKRLRAENQLRQLDEVEKAILKELLVEEAMTEAHAQAYLFQQRGYSEVRPFLAEIERKTNFLRRDFVGRYEIDPAFRGILRQLLND